MSEETKQTLKEYLKNYREAKKYFLVYKSTCATRSSSYIGKTCRHFKTRIDEHIKNDN